MKVGIDAAADMGDQASAVRDWRVVVATAFIAMCGCGCGCGDGESDPGESAGRIDSQTGTYRGVGLGDVRERVFEVFGEAPVRSDAPVTPLGRDLADVHKSPITDCRTGRRRGPEWGEWRRYEDVSYVLDEGRVCGFIVVEDGAVTDRGVAIGDPLSEAEQTYPMLVCGSVNYASEGEDLVPACAGRLGDLPGGGAPRRRSGRWIWFGGDPIDTIQVNGERLQAPR